MNTRKMLGVFVHPADVQSGGLQRVFDDLESVGTTAICISPRVARLAAEGRGVRFPPLHVDGHKRVLARPLWGKQELYLEFFNGYEPDLSLYEDEPYKPATMSLPSDVDPEVPNAMIAEAKKRGMEVHLHTSPFIPPGVRPEDQPVRIDGSIPQPPQVALNACLNSPAAEAYALALIEDAMRHFREADGLFTDWAEYGAYRLEDHFTCFCPCCEEKAREQGFDWDVIKRDVSALWDWLHSLSPRELKRSCRVLRNPSELLELLAHYPGWLQFLQFKAGTVVGSYRKVRQLLDEMGLERVTLSARGWPPPWNRSSGMDYRALADVCTVVTPKLFTFDYCVLPRWYGETLMAWNPGLVESDVLDTMVAWMNLPDSIEQRSFADYHIPAPGEPHPAKIEAYQTRVDEVVDQAGGRARCYPFAHAYLPEPQWREMVTMIRDSHADGMWVQMYGYLSDRKLKILSRTWR